IANQAAAWCGNPPVKWGNVTKSGLKPWGIATPACALVRNDSVFCYAKQQFIFLPFLFDCAYYIPPGAVLQEGSGNPSGFGRIFLGWRSKKKPDSTGGRVRHRVEFPGSEGTNWANLAFCRGFSFTNPDSTGIMEAEHWPRPKKRLSILLSSPTNWEFGEYMLSLPRQCAHWRGNPPDFPRTQKNGENVYCSVLKSWGIATPLKRTGSQ
ncbi:MAG: hypothetical protein ACI4PL_07495, partial [Faecousia sp.]